MSDGCPWCGLFAGKQPRGYELAKHKTECAVGKLRDRFAMAALTGRLTLGRGELRLVDDDERAKLLDVAKATERAWAEEAYRIADAMLAARDGTS